MQYLRWYDTNDALKQIMEIMENSDLNTRHDIANDIIQLIVNQQYDVDNFIQIINDQSPLMSNRCYDKDEIIFSAVEMLKILNKNEEKELFKKILNNILDF